MPAPFDSDYNPIRMENVLDSPPLLQKLGIRGYVELSRQPALGIELCKSAPRSS